MYLKIETTVWTRKSLKYLTLCFPSITRNNDITKEQNDVILW